jgi:hypothetical protein
VTALHVTDAHRAAVDALPTVEPETHAERAIRLRDQLARIGPSPVPGESLGQRLLRLSRAEVS